MKIAKISKKIMSLFISAMMLITSMPVSSFAQETALSDTGSTISELVTKGYIKPLTGQYYKQDPFQVISFGGGEDLTAFGLQHPFGDPRDHDYITEATKGETFVRDVNGRMRNSPYNSPTNYIEYPEGKLPGWYIEPVDRAYEVQEAIIIDGQRFERGTILGGKGDRVRDFTKAKPLSYFDEHPAKYISENLTPFTEDQFSELVLKKGAIRGEETTLLAGSEFYAKSHPYVIAEHAERGSLFGDIKRVTNYAGEVEVYRISGEWRVTTPTGHKYLMREGDFAAAFEAAPAELGAGYYKPKNYVEQFTQLKNDVAVIINGEKKVLKRGTYVGYFAEEGSNASRKLVIMPEQEFSELYRTVKEAYKSSSNRISRFILKVKDRIFTKAEKRGMLVAESKYGPKVFRSASRDSKYSGLFFRKYVKNDTKSMLLDIEGKSVNRLRKQATRTFAGVVFGIGLYLAFTLASAPSVQAQQVTTQTRRSIIQGINNLSEGSEVADSDDKADRIEKMNNIILISENPNAAAIMANDINNGGKLFKEMDTILPELQLEGLQVIGKDLKDVEDVEGTIEEAEDVVADFIADEALEEEEEFRIPFVDPNAQNNTVGDFSSFQYHHN